MLEALLFSFLAVMVGLGLCFMGYSAFRILIPILGFLGGLWLGMDIVSNFTVNHPLFGVSLGLIMGLILGLVFASIVYFVYSLAIFFSGLSLGYSLGVGLMILLRLPNGIITFFVGVVTAISIGIMFAKSEVPKLYIMSLTTFAGASILIAGVLVLFGQIPPDQLGLSFVNSYIAQSWFWIFIWIVVGSLGFFIQYQTSKISQGLIPTSYSYETTIKGYTTAAKKS